MNWSERCGVVIPCLNEGQRVGSIVRQVKARVNRVVVIDDGSSDNTGDLARAEGAIVLRHEICKGKGAALCTGLGWLSAEQCPWAITVDGDGQHSPSDLPVFWECAERTGAALVVGDRMTQPSAMPWIRRFVNGWMSHRLSRLAGQVLPDTQCGFRLLDLNVWKSLAMESRHFEIESEMLLRFIRAGHGVAFVPIQVIYADESSKISPIRDTVRWLKWWWKAR